MAVLLNTSLGDIVIDLYTDQCPLTTKNFLKLCKIKYYNNCLFHTVQKDFLVQTGDPTGTGSGGDSIYKFLYGEQARFFNDEIQQNLKHDKIGVVAMASAGENFNASQFYITTQADLDYLDGKHTVFGVVMEGEDVLMKINEAFVDEKNRPYKNIRIKHTYLLDDPFEDPIQLSELIPDSSPILQPPAEGEEVRLEDDWVPLDEQLNSEELDKSLRQTEAHSRAVVLEMIGDIPDAEIKPPENVLFVCKLNPVTKDEDLEIIFSRFGTIVSADIIRDYKTGDSLCYAFIEFETQEACEAAYFKMDNALIDDRRIHVDFSQSVSRLWRRYRRFGKKDMDDGKGSSFAPKSKSGCFKCGEFGHLAKDCPDDKEQETTQEKPKYELKSTEGQHGGASKRYDMVFDDTSGAENERDGKSYQKGSEEERTHRSDTLLGSRRSHHEDNNVKKHHESNDRKERHANHSSGHREFRDRVDDQRSDRNRHHYDRDGKHSTSDRIDERRSDRDRSSHHDRNGRHAGSDRHKSPRESLPPEDDHLSRHRVLSSTQKRRRESSPEDRHKRRESSPEDRHKRRESSPEDRHKDRHGRYESSSSRSRREDGLAKDNHLHTHRDKDHHLHTHRDRDRRHDHGSTQSRRRLESPEKRHSRKSFEDEHESRDHRSESRK